MSRNKGVLTFVALAILYIILPEQGTGGLIKAYMLAIIPYLLLMIIIWLFVTINLLRKAISRLSATITDRNTLAVAKLLRMTFDVKRFIGEQNLIALYKRVNFSKSPSVSSKTALYDAMKRKRIDIPPPSSGKAAVADAPVSIGPSKNKKKKKHRKK